MVNAMLLLSIVLEAAVAMIAVLAAQKQRPHLYGLALHVHELRLLRSCPLLGLERRA